MSTCSVPGMGLSEVTDILGGSLLSRLKSVSEPELRVKTVNVQHTGTQFSKNGETLGPRNVNTLPTWSGREDRDSQILKYSYSFKYSRKV